MPSWQDTILIGTSPLRRLFGANIIATPVVDSHSHVSIRPGLTSGSFATLVWIQAASDVHMAVDAVPNTIGQNSARLIGGQEYVFPIHPEVNTLTFIDAQSASTAVYVRLVDSR